MTEKIIKHEQLNNGEVIKTDRSQSLLETLQLGVEKFGFFATDAEDEFQIVRETGEVQGIFKVWSPHIIPILDHPDLEFSEALAVWEQDSKAKPLELFQSLEQWRAFCEVHDRRLQQAFNQRPLPSEPVAAMSELFQRLHLAFAFAAPFYNLEALVADSRTDVRFNPITFESEPGGGSLDAVAMLLPSAISEMVVADRLNWNSLNWSWIDEQVNSLRQKFFQEPESTAARQFSLLGTIAAKAQVSMAEVIFAANVLEFIPNHVGGKKQDLPSAEALDMLEPLVHERSQEVSTTLVAKEMNALIRFLNWFPAIRSDKNFQGRMWRYDAVCATANALLGVIKEAGRAAFKDQQFGDVFLEQLVPQLDGIDATSAKGRFLLQLLFEGKFVEEIEARLLLQNEQFTNQIMGSLSEQQEEESILDLTATAPAFLVGGKSRGLGDALQLFGPEWVVGGSVLTSEATRSWLDSIVGMPALLRELKQQPDPELKVKLGEQICQLISNSQLPDAWLQKIMALFPAGTRLVLRSSSFDEDIALIGAAPGIYESFTDIDSSNPSELSEAIKGVIASFFSDKAISFRELKGLRDQPLMSVVVQKFIPNAGGSVFINGDQIELNIANHPSQLNEVGSVFEQHHLNLSQLQLPQSQFLAAEQIQNLIALAQRAQSVFGASDLEFVLDPETDTIKLLQLRSLHHPAGVERETKTESPTERVIIDDLDSLPTFSGDQVDLCIGDQIDLEKFQGILFRWIVAHRQQIKTVTLNQLIPTTCHFANIIGCFGIELRFEQGAK